MIAIEYMRIHYNYVYYQSAEVLVSSLLIINSLYPYLYQEELHNYPNLLI